jgi:CRP/FNR family transcriptional regulator
VLTTATHLNNVRLFADLSDAERDRIATACRRRAYRKGTNLFYEGDHGGQLYIVLCGGVKIFSESPETGQETILALLRPGEVFGEMALLTGEPRSASAVTTENTELLLLDQASFHAILRDSFELTTQLLRNLASRLRQSNENLLDITSNTSLSRVAKLVLAQADPASGRLCPPLSQEEIASRIGVRRETVARNLAKLEASRCLKRNRGHILITDRALLERKAQAF